MEQEFNFIKRVLKLTAAHDICDLIFWKEEPKDHIKFFVNCNDLFYWAVSDFEEITEENIDALEQTVKDCIALYDVGEVYAGTVWCARIRKTQPQGAMYGHIPEELWPLLDAAGPEREIDFFNPKDRHGKWLYEGAPPDERA